METKRKSNGADGDLRASKRLKTVQGDKNVETPESTLETGLSFLEQIRRTGDKNGRRIAKNFEELPPKRGNEEYYKRIRMPISLVTIENKLRNGDFPTLSELESYVKRMVQNAKDFYPRASQPFDDAERVRKATSNFMVKHNPAYKLIHGYSAVPTPIPDELLEPSPTMTDEASPEADDDRVDDGAKADTEVGADATAEAAAEPEDKPATDDVVETAEDEVEVDANIEADAEGDAEADPNSKADIDVDANADAEMHEKVNADADADALISEEIEAGATTNGADAASDREKTGAEEGEEEKDVDAETREGENDDDEDEAERTPPPKHGSDRGARDTPLRARRKTSERPASFSSKPDHEYEGVPYKGLTFQQAQEKIMEEIIRRPDEEEEGYAYFEPFFNLPSRTLKDYFQVIKDPLSLKKLQKLVKGIRSRTERLGVSEYKSWAAFEEKASLLWENAYYYNEDGSPIANLAKELESMFRDHLRQAKAVVPEPPQPKIKIKKPQRGQEATSRAGSKRITIHVANTRGSSADSPAPKTGDSVSSDADAGSIAARTSMAAQTANTTTAKSAPLSESGGAVANVPSPAAAAVVAAKREDSSRASPALSQRPNGATPVVAASAPAPAAAVTLSSNGVTTAAKPVQGQTSVAISNGVVPNGQPTAPPAPVLPPRPAYESKFRAPGREPLFTNLALRTQPAINCGHSRFAIKMPPHPKLTQRSITLNIPHGQWRQHLLVTMTPSIQQQQRPFKMFVIANGATLGQSAPLPNVPATDPAEIGAKLYEVNLHPGVNVIQVQLIVGPGKDQKLPNGADAELERVTIFANMMKY
ncbi:bromodomain protein [Niveomyces insectorum RCEF 264]|uniref:Bromodomain protein n=1 Tax=Niveomyces insectorum RCEF 264 TaxID=1081102 RepID=A0A167N7M9_9HYPO|nr:bromodomain protein [Niveomyces insectorum RCEF 264]